MAKIEEIRRLEKQAECSNANIDTLLVKEEVDTTIGV